VRRGGRRHAIALWLCAARKINQYGVATRAGEWRWQTGQPIWKLRGHVSGILGFGAIAQLIAERAQPFGYENPQTARQAYEQVQSLQRDFIVELRGLAIVDVDADGKTHVDTPQRIVGASAVSGALFGLLLGLLFFVPGMALLGGAIGAVIGKLNQTGIDAEFRNRVEHLVEPGHSAVVIMASKITEDRFTNAMQSFGGTVLKTSLSESDERELAEDLAGHS